jgi:hypothetical protein
MYIFINMMITFFLYWLNIVTELLGSLHDPMAKFIALTYFIHRFI